MHRRLIPALGALAVGAAAVGAAASDDLFGLRKNFEIFGRLYENLVGGYVDEVAPEPAMRRAIEAMLAGLDPYTTFLDERTLQEAELARGGMGVGTPGLTVEGRDGRLVVGMPDETDAGAYRQGLHPGDVLDEVAGRPAAGLGVADALALLRGAPGTTVEVVVRREGADAPLRFRLARAAPSLRSLTFAGFAGPDTTRGVAYVRLGFFGDDAAREVRAALDGLKQRGAVTGVVLDLRDNPGGLVDQAVDLVALFVPAGTLVTTLRGREAGSERAFRTDANPVAADVPLVVLVNGLSASASEIVAGALQDHDRAVVVGAPTFGKGLVQTLRRLPYRTGLKITSGRYYLPSGRVIQRYRYEGGAPVEIPDAERRTYRTAAGRTVRDGRGIEPDVRAEAPAASALEAALDRDAAFVRYAAHAAATGPAAAAGAAPDAALVDGFRRWLAAERFAWTTPAEAAADTLLARLDAGSPAAAEARRLRATLAADREAAFARHAPALAARLRQSLAAQALAGRALTRAALDRDPLAARALGLVADRAAYDRARRGGR